MVPPDYSMRKSKPSWLFKIKDTVVLALWDESLLTLNLVPLVHDNNKILMCFKIPDRDWKLILYLSSETI